MKNIYEVIFKEKGKKYFFCSDLDIKYGISVIVETEKGLQYAKVLNKVENVNIPENEIKSIQRIATKRDYNQYLDVCRDAKKALDKARELVTELKLDMNIINSSYTFDKKQLLFNFIADDRIDFRELAKKLASIYKTRIELRQIGARDKAKEIGGLGQCGRTLCCASFLNHIDSVSMNMAKNQNLALNPSKINGQCNRLLCCLTYEDELYTSCSKGMPNIGQTVNSEFGKGQVISINTLERKYKIMVNNEIYEIELGNIDESVK